MAKSIYTITTPRGDEVDIEADSEQDAIRGAQEWDVQDFATSEATAAGLDPNLVLRTMRQESGFKADARSPKGAMGPMQLMPGTARDLGVDPADTYDNIRGGVRYLKEQRDRFGSDELALAAYNAGPGAVQKHGGVPPYAETQNYVRSIMGAPNVATPMQPEGGNGVAVSFPDRPELGEVQAPRRAPVAPQRLPQVAQRQPAPQGPTIAQDALSGFVEPFQRLGQTAMQGFRDHRAEAQANAAATRAGTYRDPSLIDMARDGVRSLGDTASLVGQAAFALPTAITQAVVRPTARGVNRILPDPIVRGERLTGDQKQAWTEGAINTALMGATAKGASARVGGVQKPQAPKSMSLEDLRTAKKDAYASAEADGFRFRQPEARNLASQITAEFEAAGGADLYPQAAPMVRRINNLAESGDLTPTQLDRYRSQVGTKLLQPGSTEADMGRIIRGHVDELMDSSNAPEWRAARDVYKQFKKAETVTNEVASAKLRASSTYAGGNEANAIRQELRPFIDPTSPRYIRNLSPAESKAFRQVVDGTGGANTWRVVGKLLDARGLLGQGMQVMFGVTTQGMGNIPAAAAGALASNRSNAATMKSVDKLLDLIGSRPAPLPPRVNYPGALPQLGPTTSLLPLLSPRGAVGAGVIAAPLARSSSGSSGRKTARSGRK